MQRADNVIRRQHRQLTFYFAILFIHFLSFHLLRNCAKNYATTKIVVKGSSEQEEAEEDGEEEAATPINTNQL